MYNKKQLPADFFFILQLLLAGVSGGSQFVRLLTTSQGLNISWLASWLAFLLINLALTIKAHRVRPSRVTLQTVCSYGVWTLIITANLTLLLWKGAAVWDAKDSVTTIAVILGLLLALVWSRWRGLPWTDPLVYGFFGVCFIGLPQVTLAYKIYQVGGRRPGRGHAAGRSCRHYDSSWPALVCHPGGGLGPQPFGGGRQRSGQRNYLAAGYHRLAPESLSFCPDQFSSLYSEDSCGIMSQTHRLIKTLNF